MPKVKKHRADDLTCLQGLAVNRDQAARLILAGELLARRGEGQPWPVRKAGEELAADCRLELKAKSPYVSRGAYKLLSALEAFHIDVQGLSALDAGASTGGFTDCLLQRGAARVYAVDAGRGLLHEKLRRDSRVICLEGVNLRLAGPGLLPRPVDLVTADLSFISLTVILPALLPLLKAEGLVIALIKPQFEAPRADNRRGVVRDEAARAGAVAKVTDFARAELRLDLQGVVPAALKGPKGNQEYLACWRKAAR